MFNNVKRESALGNVRLCFCDLFRQYFISITYREYVKELGREET